MVPRWPENARQAVDMKGCRSSPRRARRTRLATRLVARLDRELSAPGSADEEEKERLATEFTAGRAEPFKDHGNAKIYDPAIETMVKATR
ncbi:hypothetical protein [Streptomyces sp. NBC_01439]|uniref:hypothetical protein n=1 Tax=Streptomyces sp. NBC_01439 TaxID=2903867 RepID=UPI002E2DF70F|nr:hypothetical protein [Streptomyces sp. NBC_01439]